MTPIETLLAAADRRAAAGDGTGARVLCEEALVLQPTHAGALQRLAGLLLASDPAAAVAPAAALVERRPRDAEALGLLGQALGGAGRTREAVAPFRDAADLAPLSAAAHCNLSLALLRAGDPAGAETPARHAIRLDPRMVQGHANLGHALQAQGRPDEAMAAFRAGLALAPEAPDLLLGVAGAQRALGRPTAAAAALQRAVAAAPGWVNGLVDLASVLGELGDFAGATDAAGRAVALAPDMPAYGSNLLLGLQYRPDVSPTDAAAAARNWGARLATRHAALAAAPRAPDPDRTLRVGYVTADFWRHPVAWLGRSAILAHDRTAVRVHVYASQTARDDLTDAIRAGVDAWHDAAGEDDDQLAARIVADQIDVLVDLSGHTAGNRLGVFARRPAPVQVSWLGYPATTGLPGIDAALFDAAHLAPGAEALFSERLIQLPSRFCYAPPPEAPAPRLPAGPGITFGCFNNAAKINPSVIALWSRVLAAVPGSRLLLKWRSFADPLFGGRLRAHFGGQGIDPARIDLEGASPHGAMLARYGDVDIALDPFPFGGGLTSAEALWMGVPVVTLPGMAPVSRQTHAMLAAIGRTGWSAADADGYVAIAAGLAADAGARVAARQGLRAAMAASPLCDAAGTARALEAAYRMLWRARLA